ncbi:Gfo/Idh/MocA family protein [Microlunatus elymi]|uniref:Gfo/Idh/MocA family protein n=1 Tax=Microlunatus elymi TaxID=2596828 RepID=UPI001D1988DB|nr:Gfo/Idh/MocA family oxidoreductase [Microlunatus elymi]
MITEDGDKQRLRVGVVGFGWMGQLHSRSYLRVGQHYPDLGLRPELVAVADSASDDRLRRAVEAYGFADTYTDWRELIARDDIDLVSITAPNFLHHEVGIAAARAGKHVWIEKPAGRSAAETREIRDAVAAAGRHSAAGFNYRHPPAVQLAKSMIESGRLGTLEHITVRLLADYAADPRALLSWRFEQARAGSGVLGDLVSHGVDLARYLVGEITELISDQATFIPQRQRGAVTADRSAHGTGPLAEVENEDYTHALLRFAGGVRGTLESSRVAVGEQCTYGFEVHGDQGAVAWDFRRMGELQICRGDDYVDAGYVTHFVRPGDGELGSFQPGSGVAMSFDDLKVIEAAQLITAIATGRAVGPTLDDAVIAAEAVEAMQTSALERRWITLC